MGDLCDEDKKKAIAEYVALGAEKREAMIRRRTARSRSWSPTSRRSSTVSRSSTRRRARRRKRRTSFRDGLEKTRARSSTRVTGASTGLPAAPCWKDLAAATHDLVVPLVAHPRHYHG